MFLEAELTPLLERYKLVSAASFLLPIKADRNETIENSELFMSLGMLE